MQWRQCRRTHSYLSLVELITGNAGTTPGTTSTVVSNDHLSQKLDERSKYSSPYN